MVLSVAASIIDSRFSSSQREAASNIVGATGNAADGRLPSRSLLLAKGRRR